LQRWQGLVSVEFGGMAPRSLTRRFVTGTGFSFTAWRQRVRLLRALELLAAGKPVTAIALDLGYDNSSAFIALFRRVFGATPGQYRADAHHPAAKHGEDPYRPANM
jgi:AraC-like DNA-binding protein